MTQPDCPQCGGTGWKLVAREGSAAIAVSPDDASPAARGSRASGNVFAVPCDCRAGDRAARALAEARIPQRYEHCDFDNFETDSNDNEPGAAAWNRSLEQAKVMTQGFTRNFPALGESASGLLLMGPCGVGKTHLAVAALKEIVLRGHHGVFYDYNEMLKQIQASYNPDNQPTEMEVLEPVLNAELLLLDDLGASKPSAWALETVGHILKVRYNENRATVITTNYLDTPATPHEPARFGRAPSYDDTLSERIGQRIRSRLYEMCRTVEIQSLDYRRHARRAWPLQT